MDMRAGLTEAAVSVLRYDLSVPVWFPSNLFASRITQSGWIRIFIPNNTTLVTLRCRPDINGAMEGQLQMSLGLIGQKMYSNLSMIKPYDEKLEVCLKI